jgi:hypothetical protein
MKRRTTKIEKCWRCAEDLEITMSTKAKEPEPAVPFHCPGCGHPVADLPPNTVSVKKWAGY